MAQTATMHKIENMARATSLLPLALFLAAAARIPDLAHGATWRFAFDWAPSLGIRMSFLFDGLGVFFALIITGIGFFVTLYAVSYLHGHPQTGRFFFYLHAFMLSMLGLVLADNAMALFVFWEMTTLFSFLLIGFDHEAEDSRKSARQALLVTGAGGLALLVAFLLMETVTGTYEISEMVPLAATLKDHSLYGAILVFIFLGAFTKSAQFPFHFWLPNAMAAPAPVSAFLHSATMVKGGIYLLARLHPVLGGSTAWMATLIVTGAITALFGAATAIGQSDLKKILAYTTVSGLGIMTMLLGGETHPSIVAGLTFLLVHALYKSGLFLVAGIVDHQTGTRDIEKLGGLAVLMPFTAFAAFAACMSMAGFPLFFGFIGKEIMYEGTLSETMMPVFATASAVAANGFMTAVAGVLTVRPFLRGNTSFSRPVREAPLSMWIGPAVLGGTGIFFGIIPDLVGTWLISPAVASIHPVVETLHLALFHGINYPLLLSIVTLTSGIAIYLGRLTTKKLISALFQKIPFNAARIYDGLLEGLAGLARWQTRIVQNGSLHRYFYTVAAFFVLFSGLSYVRGFTGLPPISLEMPSLMPGLLVLLIISAAVTVVITRSVLLAICALGVVGAGLAMIFLSFGAPDLALTQLLVETLTVIIVAVILLRLPGLKSAVKKTSAKIFLDGLLAAATGIIISVMLLTLSAAPGSNGPANRTLTDFFEQNSYVVAHGRNIVNVILVDFRGFDTMGEIIVVATAALAGFALIRKQRKKP
jgi:multicomponent Na+:H+ antiporter subunit A